jgi:hypothetical protein
MDLNSGSAAGWGSHNGRFQCGGSWKVADAGRDLRRSGTNLDWGKREEGEGEGRDYSMD